MAHRGVTVFVTTHYMDEAEYCDRLALIDEGRIIALGTPDEFRTGHMPEAVWELETDQLMEALGPQIRGGGSPNRPFARWRSSAMPSMFSPKGVILPP